MISSMPDGIRGQPGADGPDRLIGDGQQRGGNRGVGQRFDELAAHDGVRLTGFALLQTLADAQDHLQPCFDGRADLLPHGVIVFRLALTPFGMTQNHETCAAIHQHCG
jgi:hypothetical protein